ncbi:hypothetical protein Tsubulata_019626 [Turnera subulata]|uniref:Fe2OG dioxygenase domain-containing protein n=1 Tax=Turnera subulata TaxID=218843 RepID=A0A9Q0JAM6_9ROSI|nr:hypothetical protein Tsubulata_019626 [Turnera subulata]
MSCSWQSWPEPVVPVQSLAQSGIRSIPERYVKPPTDRPLTKNVDHDEAAEAAQLKIPVIDFQHVFSEDQALREETLGRINSACREWGFFQLVNHGVSHELMKNAREVWREFFYQPLELKKEYANTPTTYEGYGSRLGVEKGAILDWSDYFFLHFLPVPLRDQRKWPATPANCRELISKYSEELVKLGGRLMKAFSVNLGLDEEHLTKAFGGDEDNLDVCMRVNYYPKCPQPDLTLGLSPHSDPGGLTILLPDEDVAGLQVRKEDNWITIQPYPNAFIINIGDQIKVLSNGIYQSVEHRVIVNSGKDRVSLAFFYNPKSDLPIGPSQELITEEHPALFPTMSFNEYRKKIRTQGLYNKKK